MQLTDQQRQMCANIGRQYPEFRELLTAWRLRELENMAQATPEIFGTLKGRVQLLTEMQQKFSL